MKRIIQFLCLIILTVTFVVSDVHAPLLGEVPSAQAQEKKRNFLQRLFGKKKKRLKSAPKVKIKKQRRSASKIKKKRKKKKAVVALPKIEDANRIVVIGDITAGAVEKGLKRIYQRTPSVVISGRIQNNVSVIGDNFYPWLDASDFTFLGDRVKAVVVALGTNDRGHIVTGENTAVYGTPQWERAYRRRLVDVSAQLQLLNIPVIWMLPPPVIDDENTEKAAAIAAIQRSAVERLNFRVVDAHGGFVNHEGKFRLTGVNLNGKRVLLRGSTGIDFTRSGARKLAYYAQKEIDDILDKQINQSLQLQAGTQLKRNAQQIAILTRPALIQGAKLAGGNGRVSAFYKDDRARDYFVGGKSLEAPKGRADNFVWADNDINNVSKEDNLALSR